MTDTDSTTTPCWIYRSSKKEEMYLYHAKEENFEDIPDALMKRFGTPLLVMELELHPDRNLAREDVSKVINNLKNIGYHLQMPPNLIPDMNDGETI
ncbi:MAG: YcgL domain-containing protein [Sedimenticola thiotaurini]|uniref:YcgL domain-containing protein FHK82_02705 n=1 Tax=Sedimenticola thiotaurini TaxID=1543721 RepID=A0A558DFU2_9GAMM|nr:MAG: YcgL domain-containing protein [Sedimenticola thiotaurini]